MVLRLYTDGSLIPRGVPHVPMLVPFLGRIDPPESPFFNRFDKYLEIGKSLFAESPLAGADAAVLPFGWEHVAGDSKLHEIAVNFSDRVRAAGKKLIVFSESDSASPIPLADAFVFRTSLYRARRRPREFAAPAWTGDVLQQGFDGKLPLRPRGARALVGFHGYAPKQSRTLARDLIIGLQQTVGFDSGEPRDFHLRRRYAAARHMALDLLERSNEIDTSITRNPSFAGGSRRDDGGFDWEQMKRVRPAFLQRLASSDYALCVRGGGNFSFRFYEALSCGRIPLFVNTDCVLPFDHLCDWRSNCVWVEFEDIDSIATTTRHFHDALRDEDFLGLQRSARAAWERWLSPEAFFANIQLLLE